MTRTVWHALIATWAVFALSVASLAIITVHAHVTRPEPFTLNIPMDCYTFAGEATSCQPNITEMP